MAATLTQEPERADERSVDRRQQSAESDRARREALMRARASAIAAVLDAEREDEAPDVGREGAGGQRRIVGSYRGSPVYADDEEATTHLAPKLASSEGAPRRQIGTYRGSPVYADDDLDPGHDPAPSRPARGWRRRSGDAKGAAPATTPPTGETDSARAEVAERLCRIAELHAEGILTDEEHAAKKADLIAML